MATFRKRGQSWQIQVRKAGARPINRTFKRKADAESWARQLEAEIERSPFGFDRTKLRSLMLVDLLVRYRDEITPSKRGADVERYRVARLLEHKLAQLTLDRLTPGQIAAYRDERLAQVGPQTVRHELNLIRHVLNIARREWDIPLTVNPVGDIRFPSPPKSRERRIEPGELERLTAAWRGKQTTWLIPLVQLAIETGIRRGELLSLRWQDVDLDARLAHLADTKNGDDRTIPLTPGAVEIIGNLPRDDGDRLFPVTPTAVRQAWDRVTKRSGIEDLHFHDLRHEAISRFFERGLSVPEVALISGHKDPRMLFRYTHMNAQLIAAKLAATEEPSILHRIPKRPVGTCQRL